MKKLIARIRSFFYAEHTPTAAWSEGGIYATQDEDGTFGLLKILKIDSRGVHLRVYSNVFKSLPQSVDESSLYRAGMNRKPGEKLGIGHTPMSHESFSEWAAIFVQQSAVLPEELDGYELWRDGGGGYF